MTVADRPQVLKVWLLATRPKNMVCQYKNGIVRQRNGHERWLFSTMVIPLYVPDCTRECRSAPILPMTISILSVAQIRQTGKVPLRVMQAGLVSASSMKRAIISAFGITALFGCFLILHGGIIMAGLVAIAILLGLAYTAGPFPIGYLGLSEFFVVFFFGSLAVAGTYFLQTGVWSSEAWLLGLAPGLLSVRF